MFSINSLKIYEMKNPFKQNGIVENNVTANAVSINSKNYAIRSVQNGNYAVDCNTVSNTYNGLAFSGTHISNAYVRFNNMSTNRYGFVLENIGIIGPQGAVFPDGTSYFPENQWLGTWTAPNYKTATLNSNAQLSKKTIVLTNGIGKLNFKAANGVYMVIITNNKTNERVIKKLVIQK